MANKIILNKLQFCCERCTEHLQSEKLPLFVSHMRDICIEIKNCAAAYVFHFCPWCGFKYYDMQSIWEKDLLDAHNIDCNAAEKSGEWLDIPEEFETNKWWINRKYFNLTKGNPGQMYNPFAKNHNHSYCCDPMYELLDIAGNDSFRSYITYIPNIRTYAILNKKEYGGFEPVDYCPFCGVKIPIGQVVEKT